MARHHLENEKLLREKAAVLRPAMRPAVWSPSLREWQCEECEEAFWQNCNEASDERSRRRATIAALALQR
jgi:hypothetical protein